MTLEDGFQFIEAKEASKRSAGRLLEVQTTNAALSQCRQTKQAMKNRQPDKGDKCHYCGQYAMETPPTIHQIRENLRTMWSPKSSWCDMPTKRKTKRPPKVTPTNPSADAEGAIFGLAVHNIQLISLLLQTKHPSRWTTTFTTTLTIAGHIMPRRLQDLRTCTPNHPL
ncbi:Hypothetical predicted protein [Paramuricea clavata]|uniref:Uncharacterized protein n=1 Tax=Paramuricea clavata TaxID=317549 RepID=A0A7D9HNR9_PARCT|nr:Hypothetical predicted protein [Paramuricea clavata]